MMAMLEKDKSNTSGNYLKMNILFLLLIISNIVLFAGLLSYYSKAGIDVDWETFEYFSSIIPTIIILGYITSRLNRLKDRGGVLSGAGALIMITVLSLIASYFSDHSKTAAIFGPYLEMFRVLSVLLIFIIMATLMLKPFKEIMLGKYTKRNNLICFIVFLLLGLYATHFYIDVDGTPANVRCMVVMISGLFGGPFVGMPVGLISGAYRYTMGGTTALPCAISTVISGIVGSLIFIWNDRKFPKPVTAIVLMFLFTGFEMFLIVMLTPSDISFPYIHNIYPLMLFASVVGIIVFSLIIEDEREKLESSGDEETLIDELEEGLKGNEEIKELKNEIKKLKSEIGKLKNK